MDILVKRKQKKNDLFMYCKQQMKLDIVIRTDPSPFPRTISAKTTLLCRTRALMRRFYIYIYVSFMIRIPLSWFDGPHMYDKLD